MDEQSCGVHFLAVFTLTLLFGASLFARIGVVRTVTGQRLEGHVRITPERVMVVNATRGLVASVDLTNILQISFPTNAFVIASDETADESLPAPWRETDIGSMRFQGSTRYEGG